VEKIYSYNAKSVDNQPFKTFNCRSSSGKLQIDTNHKLMLFFQHGDCIYHWINYHEDSKSDEPKFVSKSSSDQFFLIDRSRFLILDTIRSLESHKELHYQEIKLIECNFSNYYCEVVYREPSPLTDIVSFNIDYEKMYLFILKKVWDETDEQFKDRIFELYDLNKNKSILQI